MQGYTKLFSSLIHSTVWRSEPDNVRLVWVTMMAMAGREGIVEASIPGLADAARVSLEACEDALERLQSPDKYSRNPANEGRRVEVVAGGWMLLNHPYYRNLASFEQIREARNTRQKNYRVRKAALQKLGGDGAEDMTTCPPDLLSQFAPQAPIVLQTLHGVSESAMYAACEEFIHYWTKGGGKGEVRNFWLGKLRVDLATKLRTGRFNVAPKPAPASQPAPPAKKQGRRGKSTPASPEEIEGFSREFKRRTA